MTTHIFQNAPPAGLSRMLETFERQFEYPLGENQRFRISHGSDYGRFFRAIGKASCIAVEKDGRVTGTLCVVQRPLQNPNGKEITTTYLCDLKIAPEARGGFVLLHLARAAQSIPHGHCAFGVVMNGTATVPSHYTGRAGVPAFTRLAEIIVLRIPTTAASSGEKVACLETSSACGTGCYCQLSAGRFAAPCGNAAHRSRFAPVWLMLPDGSACGLLEDTLRAKQLLTLDGSELASSHLSCFAFATPAAGASLVRAATALSRERGLPAMFTAVAKTDSNALLVELKLDKITRAPATVFGVGLSSGAAWNINTSEI